MLAGFRGATTSAGVSLAVFEPLDDSRPRGAAKFAFIAAKCGTADHLTNVCSGVSFSGKFDRRAYDFFPTYFLLSFHRDFYFIGL